MAMFDSFRKIKIIIHKTRGNVLWGCLCFSLLSWPPYPAATLMHILNTKGCPTAAGPEPELRGWAGSTVFRFCYQQILRKKWPSIKPLITLVFTSFFFARYWCSSTSSYGKSWVFYGVLLWFVSFLTHIHREFTGTSHSGTATLVALARITQEDQHEDIGGGSQNKGTPKSCRKMGFSLINIYKPSIWAYPYFREPPYEDPWGLGLERGITSSNSYWGL